MDDVSMVWNIYETEWIEQGIERGIGDYEKVAFKELAVKLSKEVVQLCPHSISFSLFHGLLTLLDRAQIYTTIVALVSRKLL